MRKRTIRGRTGTAKVGGVTNGCAELNNNWKDWAWGYLVGLKT
jgi:hypothetical protein